MGKVKQMAYEPETCRVCGKPLQYRHKRTGRPREYCSNACKQKEHRKIKEWASMAVDASLEGKPEPAKDWRAG